jgi:hypothetical protein
VAKLPEPPDLLPARVQTAILDLGTPLCRIRRALVLLDLTGTWPTAAGASMAINSGPRPRARRWSQAIYAAYPSVEGLLYCSSMHANQPAAALFERAQSAIPPAPAFHRALADPGLLLRLDAAATLLGYQLP